LQTISTRIEILFPLKQNCIQVQAGPKNNVPIGSEVLGDLKSVLKEVITRAWWMYEASTDCRISLYRICDAQKRLSCFWVHVNIMYRIVTYRSVVVQKGKGKPYLYSAL